MTTQATETCMHTVAGRPCALLSGHQVPCDAAGRHPQVPTAPWSQVAPRLWIGSSLAAQPAPEEFDSVLTCHRGGAWVPAGISERQFDFPDELGRASAHTAQWALETMVEEAVSWAYSQWAVQRKELLIRCHTGLNRSGLLAALLLIRDGEDAEQAIARIWEYRSPYALCHPGYLELLRSAE